MVSVVIPTRNRARYVPGAVASVLAQTHRDLELIVVDDASDDDTPLVLAALSSRDRRVRVVRQERRGGAPRARNTGVHHARGAAIAFLDDDCVWAPSKLERQIPLLDDGHGVVYTRQAIRDGDHWIVEGRPSAAAPLGSLLRTNYIGTPALLVRRALFNAVGGFDEALPRLQDWDLVLRLARHTRFAYVPDVLVRGVMVAGGISMTPGPLREAAERMIEHHARHLNLRQLAALHYGLGKFLLADGHTSVARSYFRRAVRLDPRSALNWAGVAASLLGPIPARLVRGWRRRRAARSLGTAPPV